MSPTFPCFTPELLFVTNDFLQRRWLACNRAAPSRLEHFILDSVDPARELCSVQSQHVWQTCVNSNPGESWQYLSIDFFNVTDGHYYTPKIKGNTLLKFHCDWRKMQRPGYRLTGAFDRRFGPAIEAQKRIVYLDDVSYGRWLSASNTRFNSCHVFGGWKRWLMLQHRVTWTERLHL